MMKKPIQANRSPVPSLPMMTTIASQVIIRFLGTQDYMSCWRAMQTFTEERKAETLDEIWLLEHPPTFTQGIQSQPLLTTTYFNTQVIPIIKTNRGGQTTYHGPGQLIMYFLIDLKRKPFHIRELITVLENSVLNLLASFKITAHTKPHAPGVYIPIMPTTILKGFQGATQHQCRQTALPLPSLSSRVSSKVKTGQEQPSRTLEDRKICSIGLRVHHGCTYHGMALNVKMDLSPFSTIAPCGFPNLKMTQLSDLGVAEDSGAIANKLANYLLTHLHYIQSISRSGAGASASVSHGVYR